SSSFLVRGGLCVKSRGSLQSHCSRAPTLRIELRVQAGPPSWASRTLDSRPTISRRRNFYGHFLGFEEPFTVDKTTGGLLLTYFKVNDHQYIEVFPELKSETEDRLSHIAFETTDARKLRDYLASRGVAVPGKLSSDSDGNLTLTTKDPEGNEVQFVQYLPGSLHT